MALSQQGFWQEAQLKTQPPETQSNGAVDDTMPSTLKPLKVGGSSARIWLVKSAAEVSESSSETTAKVFEASGRRLAFHCGYVPTMSWSALLLSTPCITCR